MSINVDLLKVDYSKYENPLRKIIGRAEEMRIAYEENSAMAHITQTIGYEVDKEELIKALNYDRDQYAKGYKAGLNADRWISVNDRLPEEEGRYLAYITNEYANELQYIMTADFIPYGAKWFPDDETASSNVVAWMPLPPSYKAERSGEE